MLIALHKNARTTPAVRAEIAASDEPASVLAQRFGITEQTVYKWKKRDVFGDRSHTAHNLQTVLTPAQETVVVHLRRTLLLPLDDLLAVTREFICPHVSRSGLDRCLRRHGAGNLNALKPQEPAVAHKAFKSYEPGYVHMDVKYLPQMQDESSRRYLFVAIDRATRWVFVQLKTNKTAASAQAFLKALHKACPLKITKLLTDNGKEFTDRLFASREREPSGNHEFDQLCQELGIEHRLTKPRTPRTNGMVERFNGRIADVLKTHRFKSREDMEQTLLRYVALYNHQLPQSALKSKTPMQTMKEWYASHPHLFHKRPYDRPGCDIYEVLLKLGLDLCVPIEQQLIAGKSVHSIGEGALLACLDEHISAADAEPLALGMAQWREQQGTATETTAVFRDSAFENDVAKSNLAAILEQHGVKHVRSL